MTSRLLILGFHRVGSPAEDGWETWFQIPSETFERQLDQILDSGWTPIDVKTLGDGIQDLACIPEQSIVITFDDGYRCLVDTALPSLRRRDLPAILFLPTDHIGARNEFDPGEPPGDICNWEDLSLLERSGVSVQSHGASHRAFSDLSMEQQLDELRRSKAALDEGLGRPTRLFAYPFGDPGDQQAVLEQGARDLGYVGACLYPGEGNVLPVNPFRLQRIAMGPDTDLPAVLTSAMR